MVAFELHTYCEQYQYSMYAISAAYNWLFGCASIEAAGQLISSAVRESKLALLGLCNPAVDRGCSPYRATVTCSCHGVPRRDFSLKTKQLPRTVYCHAQQNVYTPFTHF